MLLLWGFASYMHRRDGFCAAHNQTYRADGDCEDEESGDDDDDDSATAGKGEDDNDDEDVVRITMFACHVAAAATSPEHDCRLRTLHRRIRWMFACLLVMVV